MKRNIVSAMSLAFTFLGIILIVVGLTRALFGRTGMNYQGLAIFGAFLACMSGGLVLYSFFLTDVSLWNIRKGAESPSRIPMALLSFGLSLMILTFLYFGILAWTDGLGLSELKTGLLIESVSAVLLVFGALTWGRSMFRANEEWRLPESRRTAVGTAVVLLGIAVDVGLTAYGLATGHIESISYYIVFMTGLAIIIGGVTILVGPFPRPWIPGGHNAP